MVGRRQKPGKWKLERIMCKYGMGDYPSLLKDLMEKMTDKGKKRRK
jgi:hypothetical protein